MQPNPIRVMHVRSVTGSGGGADSVVFVEAELAPSLGIDPVAVFVRNADDQDPTIADRCRSLGLRSFELRESCRADVSQAFRLAELMRQQNTDVLHCHDYKANLLGLLAVRLRPTKSVATLHGWGVQGQKLAFYYWLDARTIRFFDVIVPVSDQTRRAAVAAGVPNRLMRVIRNGIDTRRFTAMPARREAKRALGLGPRTPVVGTLCRLSPEKQLGMLLEAFGRVARVHRTVRLCIAGDGPERESLETLAASLGIRDRVVFLGHRSDVVGVYAALDVFALTSKNEALPMAVLEAMAAGVPVVATAVGGVPEVICHNRTGILTDPGDTDAIEAGIRELLGNRGLRGRLAREARQVARSQFSAQRRLSEIAEVYRELTGKPSGVQMRKCG